VAEAGGEAVGEAGGEDVGEAVGEIGGDVGSPPLGVEKQSVIFHKAKSLEMISNGKSKIHLVTN
jgi:hypothetical protein